MAAEGLPAHKPHGVERLVVVGATAEFVHRHDVRVFELTGDLCLFEKPPAEFVAVSVPGLKFFSATSRFRSPSCATQTRPRPPSRCSWLNV